MPIIYKRHCDCCGRYYEGRGDRFCSKQCYGRYGISEDTRQKLRLKRHGKTPTLGKKQTEVWKENHSRAMIEHHKTHINPMAGKFGKLAAHWKGGKVKESDGYIRVKVNPDDFFYPMTAHGGYVKEHRLVMAEHLGRCLQSWEIVHHRNGKKDDNRLENLQLVTDAGHRQITAMESRIKQLEQRVSILEAENTLLKVQVANV